MKRMSQPEQPILFCINNPRSLQERQQLTDAGCVSRDCLGICSRCFDTRFVAVRDEIIEGESYERIIAEARRAAQRAPDTAQNA